jgi:hypothetical protein
LDFWRERTTPKNPKKSAFFAGIFPKHPFPPGFVIGWKENQRAVV